MDEEKNIIDVILINGNKIQSEYIETLFNPAQYCITKYYDGKEALSFLETNTDISIIIIISYQLKNMTGLEVMNKLKQTNRDYGFIFLTADKTVERAVEAMKAGAIDFIPKTGNLSSDLVPLVNKAVKVQQGKIEQQKIKNELDEKNRELAKLSIVASETNNAVAIFNADLELEWVNKAFQKIHGYTKDEFIEKFGCSIMDSSNNPDILNLVQKCISDKSSIHYTIEKLSIENKKFWLQTTLTPVVDKQGNIIKLVTIDTDITELKKAEVQIIQQKKNITDSINYAQRIQSSIIPGNDAIHTYFPNSFILYTPKDVVSGDFPWIFKNKDITYIAAVDCTGHGVPGALLSFVGYFQLNNIVDHDRVLSAGEILQTLNKKVQTTLKQDDVNSTTRDGMDIALCKIDTKNQIIEYAGAHRSLYLLRDNDITEYKGNRKAIGGNVFRRRKKNSKKKVQEKSEFITHTINYLEKDRIFFFSDGLPDQINSNQEKYSVKKMQNLILSNNDKPIKNLLSIFRDDFNEWKDNYKQVDDVLLIGIEF